MENKTYIVVLIVLLWWRVSGTSAGKTASDSSSDVIVINPVTDTPANSKCGHQLHKLPIDHMCTAEKEYVGCVEALNSFCDYHPNLCNREVIARECWLKFALTLASVFHRPVSGGGGATAKPNATTPPPPVLPIVQQQQQQAPDISASICDQYPELRHTRICQED
jgi:hypothetical protein